MSTFLAGTADENHMLQKAAVDSAALLARVFHTTRGVSNGAEQTAAMLCQITPSCRVRCLPSRPPACMLSRTARSTSSASSTIQKVWSSEREKADWPLQQRSACGDQNKCA